jgi:hypothetical protein
LASFNAPENTPKFVSASKIPTNDFSGIQRIDERSFAETNEDHPIEIKQLLSGLENRRLYFDWARQIRQRTRP